MITCSRSAEVPAIADGSTRDKTRSRAATDLIAPVPSSFNSMITWSPMTHSSVFLLACLSVPRNWQTTRSVSVCTVKNPLWVLTTNPDFSILLKHTLLTAIHVQVPQHGSQH